MSQLRRLRRQQLQRPLDQLGEALKAVEGISKVQGQLEELKNLEEILQDSQRLVKGLVEDFQTLYLELDIQRETFIQVVARTSCVPTTEESVRTLEGEIRQALKKKGAASEDEARGG